MNIKKYIIRKLIGDNKQIVESDKYTGLLLELVDAKKALAERPLTKGELTMKQLGSYLPNFKELSMQTDEFKTNVARTCADLMKNEFWQYLITHLKQDQVNLYFFNDEERKSEEFVRGSINGIYIVDELVNRLGVSFKQK